VFEALERIGGRVNTINYGSGFLENGAQYVEGQRGNPIWTIARDNRLIDPKFNSVVTAEADTNDSFFTREGRGVDQNTADR